MIEEQKNKVEESAKNEPVESAEKKEEVQKEVIEVPEKFKKLVEDIEKMSILDLSELVRVLEKKFGVSAQAPVMVAGGAVAGGLTTGEEEAMEEKTFYNLELKSAGDKKIEVIKVVREITGKGLKESKDLVDSAPQMVKEGLKKEEAEEIKKKFEAAGATVELK